MDFKAFNSNELEQYKAEAKARWCETRAYKEYENRGADNVSSNGVMNIIAQLGTLRELRPDDEKVQNKIKELQQFITDNFYTCTKEILSCLGQMYTADERFKKNIDTAGGEGTADFASRAIEIYCSK